MKNHPALKKYSRAISDHSDRYPTVTAFSREKIHAAKPHGENHGHY